MRCYDIVYHANICYDMLCDAMILYAIVNYVVICFTHAAQPMICTIAESRRCTPAGFQQRLNDMLRYVFSAVLRCDIICHDMV